MGDSAKPVRHTRRRTALIALLVLALIPAALWVVRTPRFGWLVNKLHGEKTVEDRLAQYGPEVRPRLTADLRKAGIAYPPKQLIFVGLKREKELEIYARGDQGGFQYVKTYPILGASGHIGPKLEEGDCQVPEGIYRVTYLNPNSICHLSMRLDYPNEFDRTMAKKDGRTKLGSDIMIHGHRWSVGCIAVGDPASEDLFVLAADTGIENVKVIVSPVDLRTVKMPRGVTPKWARTLYEKISVEMSRLPEPSVR